jgi:hypothetical protein
VDRRDWDLVASCFTPDAIATQYAHGRMEAERPIEELLAVMRRGLVHYRATMHFLGNQLVELSGDSAQSETHCVAYHYYAGERGEEDLESYMGQTFGRFEREDFGHRGLVVGDLPGLGHRGKSVTEQLMASLKSPSPESSSTASRSMNSKGVPPSVHTTNGILVVRAV